MTSVVSIEGATAPSSFIDGEKPGHVVFCCPTPDKPFDVFVKAFQASMPFFAKAGWTASFKLHRGCAYIQYARADLLRQALDEKADVIVFLDHDLSWRPEDLLTLVQTKGPVIAGTYRFKTRDEVKYMGKLAVIPDKFPNTILRQEDMCIKATHVPAGFLKVTRQAVNFFMRRYPDLKFGEECAPYIDLFDQGAAESIWWGEDYGFSRLWGLTGEELWIRADLEICHWSKSMIQDPRSKNPDDKIVEKDADGNDVEIPYPGNFLDYMLRQPGGSLYGADESVVSISDHFASAA